jgi:CheY-like chemotaxis protein
VPNASRWDVALYAACAVFTAGLGVFTGLATHRAWAQVAIIGYAAAALVGFGQLLTGAGVMARALLAGGTWLATAVAPMLMLIARPGEWAQEEVRVVERAAALPAGEQLEAYTPYQPAMAVFGVPRALEPGGAADGQEAVGLARRHDPDVVLMDIRMPRLDGLAATRRVLDVPAGTHRPRVLMLTTFDLDEYVFEALRAGASGFLLKTRRPRELDVLRLVAKGQSNAEIAGGAGGRRADGEDPPRADLRQTGAAGPAQAVVFGYESGLVTPGR